MPKTDEEVREQASKLKDEVQKALDSVDNMPLAILSTVTTSTPINEFLADVLNNRHDLTKVSDYFTNINIVVNAPLADSVLAILDPTADTTKFEDAQLMAGYSYCLLVIQVFENLIGFSSVGFRKHGIYLKAISKMLDERGLMPDKAQLFALRPDVEYKVICTHGEYNISYDSNFLFTIKSLSDDPSVPSDKVKFIGNVQSDGNIHHVDDLPIFSSHCHLLFGNAKSIIPSPVFTTDIVLAVVPLGQEN